MGYGTGAFWDLWNWSIPSSVWFPLVLAFPKQSWAVRGQCLEPGDLWNLFQNRGYICMAQFFCLNTSVVLGSVLKWLHYLFNTLRPRQNSCHFSDDRFKCIFLNENVWILIKVLLKFVPKGPINNILALVQIMAWCRPGDKPLSEPMMVNLLTYKCVTRPQWVNSFWSATAGACK